MQTINNTTRLLNLRKILRRNMPPAEATLWKHIQRNQLGVKFRRQHSVTNYILDFYCPKLKLAIELDGSTHDNEIGFAKDRTRDTNLTQLGITVIRYTNQDVYNNLEGIISHLHKIINSMSKPT